MEELKKIITAIAEVTGLDEWSIKFGKSDECKQARDILCYISLKDMFGLTWILMELLNYRKSQVFFSADRCREQMEADLSYVHKMNKVRKNIGLSSIMRGAIEEAEAKQKQKDREEAQLRSNEISKRIFGIEWTERDKVRFQNACVEANSFMKKILQEEK